MYSYKVLLKQNIKRKDLIVLIFNDMYVFEACKRIEQSDLRNVDSYD